MKRQQLRKDLDQLDDWVVKSNTEVLDRIQSGTEEDTFNEV